jgi:hypothetical protein
MKQIAVDWLVNELYTKIEMRGDGNLFDKIHKQAIEMEKQKQDEFAIGFANWLILKCDYQRHGIFEYQGEEYTNEELLKIYKKSL